MRSLWLGTGCLMFFFFNAEDGIRADLVTGVQTCALPICIIHTYLSAKFHRRGLAAMFATDTAAQVRTHLAAILHSIFDKFTNSHLIQHLERIYLQIGRASCR